MRLKAKNLHLNHLWWCCSTCEGDEIILREKWTSILHYIYNMHEFHDNSVFKKWAHDQIGDRLWLTPGMPAHNAVKSIIMDRPLLKNMLYFSQFKHTGNREVFHSLLLKYCPKRLHFSHHGMFGRTQLAILHFNVFINAEHAVTKDNVARYKLHFSNVTITCSKAYKECT